MSLFPNANIPSLRPPCSLPAAARQQQPTIRPTEPGLVSAEAVHDTHALRRQLLGGREEAGGHIVHPSRLQRALLMLVRPPACLVMLLVATHSRGGGRQWILATFTPSCSRFCFVWKSLCAPFLAIQNFRWTGMKAAATPQVLLIPFRLLWFPRRVLG